MKKLHLSGIAADLAKYNQEKGPIRLGIIGAGEMGTDLVTQTMLMEGISIGAISARRPETAYEAIKIAYGNEDLAEYVDKDSSMSHAIERGKIAITQDAQIMVCNAQIDVIIDATGKPGVAADYILLAMQHNKHIVMMNVEADVTIGRYLRMQAEKLGVIYSLGAGDEPTSAMELIEFCSALGLTIICAGKGKNNPLNYDAVPDDYIEEAARRNMNPRMLVEFIDGSKTAVEMAAIANATGLVPDIAGMHGPIADRDELAKILIPKADGGILNNIGVVDYTIGKGVAPGVFVIAKAKHERIIERMDDLHIGKGPYYSFFRPYHLTSLEVPLTAARIMLYGKGDMAPLKKPVAEVCAIAKRDIKAGEILDAIGETSYRSFTMRVEEAREKSCLAVGLLEGGKAIKPIKKGELITEKTAVPDKSTKLYEMRMKQENM